MWSSECHRQYAPFRICQKGVSNSRPLALSGKDPWTEGSIISATQEAVQDKVIPGPEFNR